MTLYRQCTVRPGGHVRGRFGSTGLQFNLLPFPLLGLLSLVLSTDLGPVVLWTSATTVFQPTLVVGECLDGGLRGLAIPGSLSKCHMMHYSSMYIACNDSIAKKFYFAIAMHSQ